VGSRRITRVIGATAPAADLDLDELTPVGGGLFESGFEIEDARLGHDAQLGGIDAGSGLFARVRFDGAQLGGSRMRGVSLRDVVAKRVEGSNADWSGASMTRVEWDDARLTGMQFAEANLRDVTFRNCKLDLANFRMATLSHVTFEGCVLDESDFAESRLEYTRFSACQLRAGDFQKARLSCVDFRGSELEPRSSVLGLKGAIVSPLQLMELSAALAREVGIEVRED